MARSHVSTIETANVELMTRGNLDAIPTFFSPDYVAHLTDRDMTGGHQAIRRVLRMYQRAFTDIRVDVEILVRAQDRVAWQRTLRAVHRAGFKGFPGTARRIVWRDMVTTRFQDGLIVEDWIITDLAERLLLTRKR